MDMLSLDLKRQIVSLPISERLELMQMIVTSLQNDPLVVEPSINDYFKPGQVYEVWTPIEAPDAAQALLDLLAAAEASV
jgi:hypothetical protein